jgi:hypothetical protein
MRQVRVRVKPRPRQIAPDDPPTISAEIARIWFPESEQPATCKSAS